MEPGAIPLRTIICAGAAGLLALIGAVHAPAYASDLTLAMRPNASALEATALANAFAALAVPPRPVPRPPGPLDPALADVVELGVVELAALCAQGALEKLDWPAIGGRERLLPRAASDCGAGVLLRATVLAWDRDKFQAVPTWADFGDIARNPGKRGLRRGVVGTLEIALMADGVAPADVYATLRGSDGVERAFRKLDQLKPYLVFWSEAGEKPVAASDILASGEVLMTSAPAEEVVDASRTRHRSFGVQWTGGLSWLDSLAIVRNTPNLAAATQLLAFATDPRMQTRLLETGAFGSPARAAADGLTPDLLAIDPAAPANLAAAVPFDPAFWHDNGDRLGARFDAWLAR